MIKGLLDYLTGRAPLKRALQDKEKEVETYREERNRLTTETDFLKKEKDVLTNEKNNQYQTIQELLTEGQMFKDQISHLAEKTIRLEIMLEAAKQRADGLLKEVESWKAAALKRDEAKKRPAKVAGKGAKLKPTGKKVNK